MKVKKPIYVIKATGEQEHFSVRKLQGSLKKAGASPIEVKSVIDVIVKDLFDGQTTKEIYLQAFKLLQKKRNNVAARFSLKQAVMDLGPTGHPFESFVSEIFKAEGYSVEVGVLVKGVCVTHEVDVVALKSNKHAMVECKFHNRPGVKSDVKVALYIQARFEDVEKAWQKKIGHAHKFHSAWLVTNTKFTTDAITFAECVGMKAVGWNYPLEHGLEKLIERHNLHPTTCLTSLNQAKKQQLLEEGITLCRDLIKSRDIMKKLKYADSQITRAINEAQTLCKMQIS